MARWLFKEEPSCYNFAQLLKDGQTFWSGIANASALKNLRQVKAGEEIFFYHTGKEKAIVGIMVAAADAENPPQPQPLSPLRRGEQTGVMVKPVRRLEKPVTLAAIKADPRFKDWELTRVARLSIMPVPASLWRAILALAKK